MLKNLIQLKTYIISLNVLHKINIFIPKTYKLELINFLIIMYTNLKNNTLKFTSFKYSFTQIHIYAVFIYIYYFIFEIIILLI